jgi:thiosulfate reductase cytochrome b subunit
MTASLLPEGPPEGLPQDVAPPDGPCGRHADRPLPGGRTATYRHPPLVRITHWINVAAVVVLIMSGLNILAAHPHLYWGLDSRFDAPWLSFDHIPRWAMIPPARNLAEARDWHFFFAWLFVLNGLIYLAWILWTGRLRRRIWPTRADLARLGPSIVEHARLRFPKDEAARAYNVLQKLAYLAMILIVLPMMLVTGLSMSPGFNAIGGILLELMGGRQSARTLHFISAALIVGFIVVHVGLVIWTGLFNNLRAMITGWFILEPLRPDPEDLR